MKTVADDVLNQLLKPAILTDANADKIMREFRRVTDQKDDLLITLKSARRWIANVYLNNPDECVRSRPNDIGLILIDAIIKEAEAQ